MNIILIGYRGTGKSAVGGLVADGLNMDCVGMDAEIVRLARLPVPEIVEQFGWSGFRDMETRVAKTLSARDNLVIDTGGGVIERSENIAALRESGLIFWLTASVDVIISRISGDTQRPALVAGKTFTEEVAEVLSRRTPKYKRAAQYEIETDRMTPHQVAKRIIEISRDQLEQ